MLVDRDPGARRRSPWRRVMLRTATALVLAVIGTPGAVPTVEAGHATGHTAAQPTVIRGTFQASSMPEVPDYLVGRLVGPDGSAIADAEVVFTRTVALLGERRVVLGRSVTDAAGEARIPVVPKVSAYRVEISFAGTVDFDPSVTVLDVAFPPDTVAVVQRGSLAPPFVASGLRPVADVMPRVMAASAAAVWLVLIALTLLTLRRIASESPRRG